MHTVWVSEFENIQHQNVLVLVYLLHSRNLSQKPHQTSRQNMSACSAICCHLQSCRLHLMNIAQTKCPSFTDSGVLYTHPLHICDFSSLPANVTNHMNQIEPPSSSEEKRPERQRLQRLWHDDDHHRLVIHKYTQIRFAFCATYAIQNLAQPQPTRQLFCTIILRRDDNKYCSGQTIMWGNAFGINSHCL